MTSDFEGFLYQILSITLFSYLNSWERASIFPFECSVLNKGTIGTIFITSLVWRGPWLGIEPGTSRTRSHHYTPRLSRRRLYKLYDLGTFITATSNSKYNKVLAHWYNATMFYLTNESCDVHRRTCLYSLGFPITQFIYLIVSNGILIIKDHMLMYPNTNQTNTKYPLHWYNVSQYHWMLISISFLMFMLKYRNYTIY